MLNEIRNPGVIREIDGIFPKYVFPKFQSNRRADGNCLVAIENMGQPCILGLFYHKKQPISILKMNDSLYNIEVVCRHSFFKGSFFECNLSWSLNEGLKKNFYSTLLVVSRILKLCGKEYTHSLDIHHARHLKEIFETRTSMFDQNVWIEEAQSHAKMGKIVCLGSSSTLQIRPILFQSSIPGSKDSVFRVWKSDTCFLMTMDPYKKGELIVERVDGNENTIYKNWFMTINLDGVNILNGYKNFPCALEPNDLMLFFLMSRMEKSDTRFRVTIFFNLIFKDDIWVITKMELQN